MSIPEWTTSIDVARAWNSVVVSRHLLRSSEGRGITIADTPDAIQNAPLYVKYIKKLGEYRVHVAFGEVLSISQKRRRNGNDSSRIRNTANGYVFCRDNVVLPEGINELALKAVQALGLDFGAVDIIYNRHYNQCYVLEVNTAPGIEGTTVNEYANAFVRARNLPAN